MRRGFVALALVTAFLAATPIAGANEVDPEDEIRAAYAAVLDRHLPMRERVAGLEDGDDLRATLRELDGLDRIMGMEIRSLDLHVDSVRAHHGDAEVQLSVLANLYMVTGYTGVARKVRGEWVVARATVCTLLMEWTPIRCPGGPQRYRYEAHEIESTPRDDEHVLALTFADGAAAQLVVPREMASGWTAQPMAELVLDDGPAVAVWLEKGRVFAQQSVRSYPGPPGRPDVEYDAMRGLVVDLDGWTAFVTRAYSFTSSGEEPFSERDRALVAQHLTGFTTDDGFPVLTPTTPLRFAHREVEPTGMQLVKSALSSDPSRLPIRLTWSDGDDIFVMVLVTPGPCVTQPPQHYADYWAIEQCTDNGFGRIAVEGNPYVVAWLLDELHLDHYRPRTPTVSV